MRTLCLVLFVLSIHRPGLTAPRNQYHITDLGFLPGGNVASPSALNNHGHVVGWGSSSNGLVPFIYRDGVMREIPLGNPNFAQALDINDAGDILAELIIDGRAHALLVTPESTIDLNEQTGLGVHLSLRRMNENRVVVGTLIDVVFVYEAVAWNNGVVHRLGVLETNQVSYAKAINNAGDILGVATLSPPHRYNNTVVFRNGGISVLGTFSGAAINDLGEVAGVDDDNGLPCLYRDGKLTHLGLLPGDHRGWAIDINNSGQIVGVSEGAGEVYRPFLYDDGVMYDLQQLLKPNSGWVLYSPAAINDRGQIIGVGYFHGRERPFLLTPKAIKSRRRP